MIGRAIGKVAFKTPEEARFHAVYLETWQRWRLCGEPIERIEHSGPFRGIHGNPDDSGFRTAVRDIKFILAYNLILPTPLIKPDLNNFNIRIDYDLPFPNRYDP